MLPTEYVIRHNIIHWPVSPRMRKHARYDGRGWWSVQSAQTWVSEKIPNASWWDENVKKIEFAYDAEKNDFS